MRTCGGYSAFLSQSVPPCSDPSLHEWCTLLPHKLIAEVRLYSDVKMLMCAEIAQEVMNVCVRHWERCNAANKLNRGDAPR